MRIKDLRINVPPKINSLGDFNIAEIDVILEKGDVCVTPDGGKYVGAGKVLRFVYSCHNFHQAIYQSE